VQDAVILDLSRLDQILDLDLRQGTARIEPGVTFRQLQTALKQRGLKFHLPSFGGPTDASVLANALERGEAQGPYSDRFGHLWDLDVALTSGERIRTGHGRYGEHVSALVDARPAGPLLEGLFSQSGFGVVLSGRLALAPTPELAFSVMMDIGPSDQLDAFVGRVRTLLRNGVLEPSAVFLCNKAKQLSQTLVRKSVAEEVLTDPWLSTWTSIISVTGDHVSLVDAKLAIIKDTLGSAVCSMSVESDREPLGNRVETHLTGFSDGRNVISCYWEKDAAPTVGCADPDRDHCGFLWVCPALPLDGSAIRKFIALTEEASRQHGLLAAINLRAVSLRAAHAYVSLAWDRNLACADERALACHEVLVERLWLEGFLPFRLSLLGIDACHSAQEDWISVVSRIRGALDPAGVLSRGKTPGLLREAQSPVRCLASSARRRATSTLPDRQAMISAWTRAIPCRR
jgi:4-cresol dehydrogenase (hydroxylating)